MSQKESGSEQQIWDQLVERRSELLAQFDSVEKNPTKEGYESLITATEKFIDDTKDIIDSDKLSPNHGKEMEQFILDQKEHIITYQGQIQVLNQSSSDQSAPQAQDTTANVTTESKFLNPTDALAKMQGLLAEAKQNKDKIKDNHAEVFRVVNNVKQNNDERYLKGLVEVLKEFKILMNPPQLSSGVSAASAQAVVAKSAQKDDVVMAKAVAPNSAQTNYTAAAEAAVELAQPAPRSSGPAMEVKVDEGVLPAGGLSKNELQKQLTDIAKDNKWGISFPGNDIKIVDQGQSVTVSPTKEGMKIEGSSELGVKVLDKWCEKNKFDKLDVKVKMPTVDKNIDASSPEGAAAFKTFEEYTKKGFYVKDKEGKPFPIDNFKPAAGQDQTQFNALKAQYADMQQRVESKAEQKIGPSASG